MQHREALPPWEKEEVQGGIPPPYHGTRVGMVYIQPFLPLPPRVHLAYLRQWLAPTWTTEAGRCNGDRA